MATLKEAADYFRVSYGAMHKMALAGKIPTRRKGATPLSDYEVDMEELERYFWGQHYVNGKKQVD